MSDPSEVISFSDKVKNEVCQVRSRSVTERQAVVAGAFCAASPEGMSFPSTYVRTTPQACLSLAGMLAKDGFVHLVKGNKIMVLQQSFTSFYSLMSSCFLDNAKDILLLNTDFVKCFLRGAFLSSGYCSDPAKAYRVELRIANEKIVDLIVSMLELFEIDPLRSERDTFTLLYFKNGDKVADFLRVIGAMNAVMDFENIRAAKDVNGRVMRTFNCDSGNLKRTADASAKRSVAFDKIMKAGIRGKLPKELKDTIDAHYKNPEASITELASMMDPPIGKSGMNHRITKLLEIAETLD